MSENQNKPANQNNQTAQGDSSTGGTAILLKEVTKSYPGQVKAAVGGLTLEIPAGSVVMFVGPSGCGKTTTLKMINRLIEPTEGQIIINDEDVTGMDADKLRRSIGYVIQAGGLFPHMTVAANIAIVPKMLGWDKARITARVDELLELVSLDPAVYRDRYPKELSGGQQQRVGVARALAADPPVLLMDEPFGAVDPITRQRLQDELLNIQAELHKTIVCVTHDFDEAMKLGDWIAVFDEGAQLVQYDSPERILAQPANEFVEGFIGSGAALKQLSLQRVRDVTLLQPVTASPGENASDVLSQLQGTGAKHAVVLDARRRPIQWLSTRQLSRMEIISDQVDPSLPQVGESATLNDALDEMLVASSGQALVTGARGAFVGLINVESVTEAIAAARRTNGDHSAPVGLNSGTMAAVAVAAADQGPDDALPLDGDGPDGTSLEDSGVRS
ncbi:ATP-binding cassette domain-containing protein [Galactobacter caseinivorans]|uniref:ABC-type quaternary amine transporter n=1 Tax=Galactobacter caseinivorans TaxID=2676123 RepID=A0A496PI13_9MICC|nr:ATP-binding cassette domain-containing protein [Galactobacter caseinivorans]